MNDSEIDESIPRYKRGYEWFSYLGHEQLRGRPWRRLGIFSFYDAPYAESDLLYLSPKQVMLTMASLSKKKESGLVFVVDSLEKAEMGLSTPKGFSQFMELFDESFPGAEKFYFGPKDSDRDWLHEYQTFRIPLAWLITRPNIFAEVLSDASPVGEDIGPADASFEDFHGMNDVLVEKLGPPSLTEEVMGKIKSTEASEYAGEAVGLMTVFISPTTAVSRGVKYLGKFMGLLKDRRKQEVKEVYEEWEDRVKKGYSIEKLRKFFDEDPDYKSGIQEAVEAFKPVLLITETRGTLYDLFLPLILQHLVEEVGYLPPHLRRKRAPAPEEEETAEADWDTDSLRYESMDSGQIGHIEVESDENREDLVMKTDIEVSEDEFEGKPETILFIDAATHLSKFNRSFEFALNIPEKYPNMSVAASFYTNREKISDALTQGVREYMSERALVFDLHPDLFDLTTSNVPITRKAWLMGRLQEMEKMKDEGGCGFLEYYEPDRHKWKLHIIKKPEKGVLGEIMSWFRKKS
ncbi:hypothetical protein EU538_02880 [Candidatus Thorarchaeota archaeon]|jgi:hypothetical protein|nr:MAG: hypothetical protein EU538_02880 [Candidatus Thorarchaeota archaeon]